MNYLISSKLKLNPPLFSSFRCSVVTDSGKIATWYDESVNHVCGKLEHPATLYPDFQADKIVSLHTCVLFTAVRLDSGAIYWWGVLPFAQRKKLLEKYTNKKKSNSKHQKKKPKPSNSASNPSNNEITVGSQVCMRKAPMYHAGKNIWLDIERDTVWTVNV